MPAKSKSQQKLMGMVHATQTGQIKAPSEKVAKLAKSMTKKSAKDYASTKHKGLPKKVKKTKKAIKENYENKVGNVYSVLKPYPGCNMEDLVHELDPVMGASHKGIDAQTIHGIYGEEDEAKKVAEGLHSKHIDEMKKLEEKKDSVAKKLTSTIDKLEKQRKDHVKMAKENPDHAGEHKQHISNIEGKIKDLMDKLEKVEKSKKKEETEEEDGKKKVKESLSLEENFISKCLDKFSRSLTKEILEAYSDGKNGRYLNYYENLDKKSKSIVNESQDNSLTEDQKEKLSSFSKRISEIKNKIKSAKY